MRPLEAPRCHSSRPRTLRTGHYAHSGAQARPRDKASGSRRIRVTRVSKRKATTAVSGSGKLLTQRLVGVWSPIAIRLLPGILRSCRGCIQRRPTRHCSRCPSTGSRPAARRCSWCHRTRRCSKGFCADSVASRDRLTSVGWLWLDSVLPLFQDGICDTCHNS